MYMYINLKQLRAKYDLVSRTKMCLVDDSYATSGLTNDSASGSLQPQVIEDL